MKLWRNMGKTLWQIGFVCILLFAAGCGKTKAPDQASAGNEGAGQGKITIAYDRDQIEDRDKAWRYKADYYTPDEDLLCGQLFRSAVAEEESQAVGKTLWSEGNAAGKDALTLYSGGQGEELWGGFLYYYENGKTGKEYQDVVAIQAEHPDAAEQIFGYNAREDYSRDSSLDFMGREDVQAYVLDLTEKCRMPEMQIQTIYALDQDTMQAHREAEAETDEAADPSIVWEKEDEAYLLQLSEVIDGIPVMDHYWEIAEMTRDYEPTEVPVEMIVSGEGVVYLGIKDAVTVKDREEECALLTAQEAEDLFFDSVKQTRDLTAEALALKYIVLHDGTDLVLTPAWVFCVSRDTYASGMDSDELVPIKAYEHYVFDAVTGERIHSAQMSE